MKRSMMTLCLAALLVVCAACGEATTSSPDGDEEYGDAETSESYAPFSFVVISDTHLTTNREADNNRRFAAAGRLFSSAQPPTISSSQPATTWTTSTASRA